MGLNRRRRTLLHLSAGLAAAGLLRAAGAGSPAGAEVKAKVLIVGGGFGGSSCALALRHLSPAIEVTLVDPDDRYFTCPMSDSVIVGLRSLESIAVSRRGLIRAGVRYIRDRVGSIDVQRRRARLAGGAELQYDRLVMAAGIRCLWGRPEGYSEAAALQMPHAWQAGPQTEILAAQLHAMRDGGVFAISVPAGPMRCPPGPFERASLVAGYLKEHKPRSKVLIFDANNRFPRQDVFLDAWRALYPGMIDWIPVVEDGAVIRVEPEKRILHTQHGAHPVDVANIIPPQAPALLAAQAGLASEHGWCPADARTFESPLAAKVHVIGDACIADPLPKAASAAHSEAGQCALAIVAALQGREPPVPQFESVCYSMLARGRALSIHARFRWVDGAVQPLPAPQAADSEQEARNADEWYRTIVRDSFGA